MINKKLDEISAKLETIKVLVQDNEYLSNVEKSCDEVSKRNQILENRIQKATKALELYINDLGLEGRIENYILDILRGKNE